MVINRLKNEKYAGTMVYNQTSQKLKTPCRRNPPAKWVRTPEAFEGIVTVEQFLRAQEIFGQRRRKYVPERMLEPLNDLYNRHGLLYPSLLRSDEDMATAPAYARHFGSADLAFQRLFSEQRDQARDQVHEQICQHVPEVLTYSDFLVLDQKLTVSVQPAVPMLSG